MPSLPCVSHWDTLQDFLVIDQISKSFGTLRAVDRVSLSISQGEVFTLLGPSGCGKTTLLRILAGFEPPDCGRILLRGLDITALPPEQRPVNTVFQNYALFPHLSVWENIAFGLRMKCQGKAQRQASVERMLSLVRLEGQAHQRPAQLSGGQRQRVAIARALVNEPEVLLLDEPLAALDLKLRQHMLSELSSLQRVVGTTFIYITHDQGEALSLSQRVAVMNEGRIEQVAAPASLYEAPANAFVAGFIGDANFLHGKVLPDVHDGQVRVELEGIGRLSVHGESAGLSGERVRLMIRPEKLKLSLLPAPESCPVVVEEVIYYGPYERIRVCAGSQTLHVQQPRSDLAVGIHGFLSFEHAAARVLD